MEKLENFKRWSARFKDWHPNNAEIAATWAAYLEGIRFTEAAQQSVRTAKKRGDSRKKDTHWVSHNKSM